jgi:hypothetical protein
MASDDALMERFLALKWWRFTNSKTQVALTHLHTLVKFNLLVIPNPETQQSLCIKDKVNITQEIQKWDMKCHFNLT